MKFLIMSLGESVEDYGVETRILAELKAKAEKSIGREIIHAEKIQTIINARRENVTMSGLIVNSVLTVILSVVFFVAAQLFKVWYFETWLQYGSYTGDKVEILFVISIAVTLLWTSVMIGKYIITARFYKLIFDCDSMVSDINCQLKKKQQNLELRLTQILNSQENEWNLTLNKSNNVEKKLDEIGKQIVDKGDFRTNTLDKILIGLFYLGLTLWLGFICSVSFSYLSNEMFEKCKAWCLLFGWEYQRETILDVSVPAVWLIYIGGAILTYWLIHLCMKYYSYEICWWSSILWLTGAVANIVVTIMLIILGLIVGAILALINALATVAVYVIAIVILGAIIIGIFSL